MKFRTLLISLIFSLVSCICFADIRVEKIVAGLDGFVRGERWAPVMIDVRNDGDDFIGMIQVLKGETIFQKSLHLPAGGKKRVELIYYHSNFYETLNYRILNQKGQIVAKNRIDIRPLNYMDNLLLVVSSRGYSHQFLNGTQNPWSGKTFVAYIRPEDLYDESIAYSAADAIALGDFSPSEVGEASWKALMQSISSGGVLVCSAGTSRSVLTDPLVRENVPEISAETDKMNNGGFLITKWGSRSSDPFPQLFIPTQTMRLRPCDRQLIAYPDASSSLIASSPYYKGNIVYFAFDYTRLPEQITLLFANFWNDIIFRTSSTPPVLTLPFRKRLEENPQIQKFLYDVPGLQLPDVKWFALFFFVYLFALGPLQYAVLRMLKKNSLLWITFPVLILVFSVASFGYSRFRHSNEQRITQVSVTEVFPLLRQQTIYQVYGMATSNSGDFDFQALPPNSFLRKSAFQTLSYLPEPYTLSEDLPRQLLGETLKSWTFRTFDAIATQPQSIAVRVTISIEGEHLHGEVSNSSEETIRNAFFYYDARNSTRIGSIAPGATTKFEIMLTNTSAVPFSLPHLRDLLNLYNLSYSYPHFLFGEIGRPEGTLNINRGSHKTNCQRYLAIFVDTRDARPMNGWIRRPESP